MDRPHPPDAWKRLGEALEQRRGQLGYGYRQRGKFARERGSNLSVKTLARLERGERGDYPPDTIAAAEALYGWEPGSIARVLNGGEAVPVRQDNGLTDEQIVQALEMLLTRRRQDGSNGENRRPA
jgi:hypothetical protein